MTAVVYAHKAGRGNGVGLHYSRFRPAWRFIILPNQRLGLMPPSQNRHFPPRIREVGLARSSSRPEDFGSDFRPPSGSGRLVLRVSNWTRFKAVEQPPPTGTIKSSLLPLARAVPSSSRC